MQSDSFVDVAASVAVVATVAGLFYARASARAAREGADAAHRSMELAERSRQSAARARLRGRVERVGELVQDIATSCQADATAGDLSQNTRAQCRVLHRAVNGLADVLPRTAELPRASSATEMGDRAAAATLEIEGVLKKLSAHRPLSAYRPRHQVPWNRPSGARSGATAAAAGRSRLTRPPSP